MSDLTTMMNIGREMEKKLTSVGIDLSDKLVRFGAKQAFMHLMQK